MIYCNISECKNWLPLPDVHLMKNKPGFKPIGKTGEYVGRCSFSAIKINSTTAKGLHTKQVLAVCGSYNTDAPKTFECEESRCFHYLDGNGCDKVKQQEDLYIDKTVAFTDMGKTEVNRCKVFAHRWRENAFDWGKAAQGIF
jgi:hypothetical protein